MTITASAISCVANHHNCYSLSICSGYHSGWVEPVSLQASTASLTITACFHNPEQGHTIWLANPDSIVEDQLLVGIIVLLGHFPSLQLPPAYSCEGSLLTF